MDEKHSSYKVCEDEFTWAEEGHYYHYRINDIRPTKCGVLKAGTDPPADEKIAEEITGPPNSSTP